MNIKKGASAVALGLFLYFLLPAPCPAVDGLSLSGQTGTLWVDKDGSAWYWDAGLSYRSGSHFFAEMNVGQLISGLAQVDGDIDLFRYRSGFDTDRIGFQVSGVFFRHDFLSVDFGKPRFYNDRGSGLFINNDVLIHLGPFDIIPSFLFGQGSWGQGSFYWFFGKADIPAIYGYGLAALYGERHLLQFRHLRTNVNILNNDRENLFTAGFDGFTGSYTLKGEGKTLGFEGTLGWLYTTGTVDGALTMSNQGYVLFPFRFFNLAASLNMHAGYGLVRFRYHPGIFRLNISLGGANIFLGDVEAAYDYQMKKLFSGTEAHEKIGPFNLANTGAVFLLFDTGIRPPIGKSRNFFLSLGIQKAFIIPWGYEKIVNAGTEDLVSPSASLDDGLDMEIWRTILLSGLSFYLTVSR
jgi:hypothetical protein